MKRKRKPKASAVHNDELQGSHKRRKLANGTAAEHRSIHHPVLSSYYNNVYTLRQYLLKALKHAGASKHRKRALEQLRFTPAPAPTTHGVHAQDENSNPGKRYAIASDGKDVAHLLDHVRVGVCDVSTAAEQDRGKHREQAFEEFTQQMSASWHGTTGRSTASSASGNTMHESLKSPAWRQIRDLLGSHGDQIIVDLLVQCGLFAPPSTESDSTYQLSGVPLSDLTPLQHIADDSNVRKTRAKLGSEQSIVVTENAARKHSCINFVRYRMLYARATLNAKGSVRFGLRHIYVLNRFPNANDPAHTRRLVQYIFPRQFKLHNVFTSTIDPKDTAQPFKDYTMREQEIAQAEAAVKINASRRGQGAVQKCSMPKRLRGAAFVLIRRLHKRHQLCSYTEMLRHYCACPNGLPAPITTKGTTGDASMPHFASLATPHAQVSAFCRAVIWKVLPHRLISEDSPGGSNWRSLMKVVDHFICARRFETFSLEYAMRGLKIKGLSWLRPEGQGPKERMAASDFNKRSEIFAELIYYVFDSFLIPLIRANFHVTESSTHRHRLFYFRHDVWRRMIEPAVRTLKHSMLDEMKLEDAVAALNGRAQGFSQIRFLPKEQGMRSITNLRRRAHVLKNGVKTLGRSINSIVAPAFNVLNFEKLLAPERLGSSLFSINGMHDRVKTFGRDLREAGLGDSKLYFVKVDVRSCFDTLPQELLLKLVNTMLSSEDYSIARCTEIKAPHRSISGNKFAPHLKPLRQFHAIAQIAGQDGSFATTLMNTRTSHLRRTTWVDNVVKQNIQRDQVMELLSEHIRNNIVKIGKRYYRQRKGIPQGSVLSSILCNIGYADFEKRNLAFLSQGPCLLLRLIDDFLVITPSKAQAERFLSVMQQGSTEYGISVKHEKTLTNFVPGVGNGSVAEVNLTGLFPYCGLLINQTNLNIAKDLSNPKRGRMQDTLTVEYSRAAGGTFRRKILNGLKIQMHTMLLDTSHNSLETVMMNVYQMLRESAIRSVRYLNDVSKLQRPTTSLLKGLIDDLTALAYDKTKSRHANRLGSDYRYALSNHAVQWLTLQAFIIVLESKQATFRTLVIWLRRRANECRNRSKVEQAALHRAVRGAHALHQPRAAEIVPRTAC